MINLRWFREGTVATGLAISHRTCCSVRDNSQPPSAARQGCIAGEHACVVLRWPVGGVKAPRCLIQRASLWMCSTPGGGSRSSVTVTSLANHSLCFLHEPSSHPPHPTHFRMALQSTWLRVTPGWTPLPSSTTPCRVRASALQPHLPVHVLGEAPLGTR